jgi:hypothetical protein
MAENGNIRRQLGVSRRDLLRRGAVVGGTLLWTIPVVSTISRAHMGAATSPAFPCCECRQPRDGGRPHVLCQPKTIDTRSQCEHACRDAGYRKTRFHLSPTFMACDSNDGCAAH